MKKIIILLLLINLPLQAQKKNRFTPYKLGLDVGYKYKYTNNASFGLSYKLNEECDYGGAPICFPVWSNVNISYLTDFNNEHFVMIGITKSYLLLELGLNTSTKMDIEPTLGFNIGNYGRINFGYNIAFKQKNNFTFGISYALGREGTADNRSTYYVR